MIIPNSLSMYGPLDSLNSTAVSKEYCVYPPRPYVSTSKTHRGQTQVHDDHPNLGGS